MLYEVITVRRPVGGRHWMEAIIFGANLALLLSSAVSGLWAFKARQRAAGAAVMLGVWALGCAFIACAIAGQWSYNFV